jgi:hypothetical protein
LGLLAANSPDYNGSRFASTLKNDKTLRRFCRDRAEIVPFSSVDHNALPGM